jgi:DedD protein
MAEARDVEALKRRGRRRLVGAIALVLAAVIVLPMVFDTAPKRPLPPVSVRIPAEDDAAFRPKVTPVAPAEKLAEKSAAKAEAPKAAPKAEEPKPAAKAEEPKPPPKADEPRPAAKTEEPKAPPKAEEPKAPPKPAAAEANEKARAERALADAQQYYVQVGAFADPTGVYDKLKAAGIPYYTESIATKAGKVMRVRAGPFSSRETAQKTLQQLKGLGFKPADVAAKS